VVLAVALTAGAAALWRARPGRALRLFAAAGLGLVVLPLTEPPLVVAVAVAALLAAAVPWALGRGGGARRLSV
jgi:membrane-associated PAP2 superfamily phosphatase